MQILYKLYYKIKFISTLKKNNKKDNEEVEINENKIKIICLSFYSFINLLSPFTPHLVDELYNIITTENKSLVQHKWPIHNEKYLTKDQYELAISVNGKVRAKIQIDIKLSKEEIEEFIINNLNNITNLTKYVENKQIHKIIVVPGKIANIVVK